jgi:glucose/arabinose dehydrogenase
MQPHIRMGKSVYLFVTIALALLASIGTLLGLLIGAAKGAANLPQGFTDSPPVVSGLSNPTDMEFAPDGKLFVLEQAGRVRFVRSDGTLGTFLNISTKVDATGERGLLGIAFDPAFATNRYVYLHYTRKATSTVPVHNRVVRVRANATNTAIVSGSEKLVFRLNNLSSATNHNGGDIHFSPANKLLYIATGDNAQPSNAQSLNNLKGKILRINKNGTIPTSNPFYTAANNTQGLQASGNNRAIFALGFRNPFKFTFNKIGSLLFVNDVGANAWEEINEVSGGGNYGWPLYEGQENDPKYANPVYAYGHDGDVATTGCAITGGAFYDPQVKMFPPEYHDQYFFADFCSGWIRHFRGTDFTVSYPFASDLGRAVDIQAKDSTGELYYLVRGAPGTVNKISYSVTTPP